MKPLPHNDKLRRVARRVVWFKEPDQTLDEPIHFLAHVMTYGTVDDLKALQDEVTADDFCEALNHAPPGVIDARSWAYWNLVFNRPQTPLPTRF